MRGAAVSKDVDAYIKNARDDVRPKLKELRAIVKAVAPKADEGISYGMPYYKLDGALCGFAAFKNHIGFFPGAIVKDFADELKGYATAKGTVRLPLDKKLPVTLIKRMVRAGMVRNAAKKALKTPEKSR